MPFQMFVLAEKSGVNVLYWDFANPFEAVYISLPGCYPVIGLCKSLFSSRAHFRSVFAEELGHHFTSAGTNALKPHFHYADKLLYSRDEYRAMQWAVKYLIPEEKLEKAVRVRGLIEVWQLAEYFCVDEEIIDFRLRTLKKNREDLI
ncbi:MAG TPA: hypothetical protein DD734_04500 [Firmicutes bacterium]|nr:hypothetical protein [Bacillota bacterium]